MADKVSKKTLALAKSYVRQTADALGAVKGAPCTVKSIEDATGGKNITYEWTGTSGAKQTQTVFFPNGADGAYVENATIDANNHLILTLSNGSEIDAGELPSGGGDSTEYEFAIEGTKLTVTDSSTGIKQSLQLPTSSAGGIVNDLPVGLDVGGIKKPKTYVAGTEVETILNDLLNPVTPPTISNPKATLSCNKSVFIYGIDESIGSVQFTLNFERGTISSGGHTVGEATGYTIDGQSGRVVVVDLDAKATNKITITGNVAYGQGDQAYNSDGTPYGTPRPASSINSNSITFEKKPYIYTTKSGAFARMPIAQYNSSPLQIALPNGDDVSSPICKIGLPSRATELLVKNELTGQYVDCSSEFDESTEQIDGRTYYIYKDNRGSRSGDRDFKFSF